MFPNIDIFGASFDTWNFCLLMSLLVVLVAVLIFRPKDFPLKRIQIFWATILFIFSGLLGANLLNIFLNLPQHQGQAIQEVFSTSGTAYLGTPLLGLLALWIFSKNVRVSFLTVADYAAPFLMLERIIGRIGCLGYGCCYGIPSNLPWAYPFHTAGGIPSHPTQAYALICALAIFVSSRYLYKRIRGVRGIAFFYVVLCYSILRFFNEFLRAEGPFVYGPVKLSHIALFIFAVIALIGLFIILKKSSQKDKISKPLKGAFIRLFIWLVGAGAVLLLILSIVPK